MKYPLSHALGLVLLLPFALGGTGANAQNLPQSAPPAAVPLDSQLFKLDSIGFTMPMPEGCNKVYDRFGSIPQGYFFPEDLSWKISVGTVLASSGRETRNEFVDNLINTELRRFGKTAPDGTLIDSTATVLLRQQTLNIGIGTASRFYYRYPNIPNPRKPDDWIIRGRTVIQMLPQQGAQADILTDAFLVLTLECPEPQFTKARSIYETLVSAATLIDPALLSETRSAKVMAGEAFFASLTPADFEAVIGDGIERWEHLVVPKELGGGIEDAEIAFRQIQISLGSLADAPELGGPDDPGIIVRLRARSLIREQSAIIDTNAVFFVSKGLTRETWFVKTAIYNDESLEKQGSAQELGSRSGSSMNIRVEGTGIKSTTVRPLIEGEGYISRSLIWLLPSLLAHQQTPADYGFYAYNSAGSTISFRQESLDTDPDHPGGWIVTSHITTDQPPQITTIDPQGAITQIVLPQGQIWKPIKLPDLLERWQQKGLPTGSLSPGG
jgi:hypothetical protein